MYYRQCNLERGTTKEVAWIPEEFAEVGKHLSILDQDGWRVTAVYGRKAEEFLLEHERDYLSSLESIVENR